MGGKYDLDSALWGQSTTSAPYWLNDVVISSESKRTQMEESLKVTLERACIRMEYYYYQLAAATREETENKTKS